MKNSQINEQKIHDFSRKLRQKSAINQLNQYIKWQKKLRSGNVNCSDTSQYPSFGPISINLDITTTCNFSCIYCVDMKILNKGKKFNSSTVFQTIDTLQNHGLKSVLLIGGGEPLLHPDFIQIVRYIKDKNLQIGIVTNGSIMHKLVKVADVMEKEDWIRLSLDAGTNETFQFLHRPRNRTSLDYICKFVREIKRQNDLITIGCSYILTWEKLEFNGLKLINNINEILKAVELAINNEFDYISFKPCLTKIESSNIESLKVWEEDKQKESVINNIINNLAKAKDLAKGNIKIVTSLNLQAMLNDDSQRFKQQPTECHIQAFRQVISPIGIFHCPAYRGFERAKISEADGFLNEVKFSKTTENNFRNLLTFNAKETCKDIVCFYNQVNNWIEKLIQDNITTKDIEPCEDINFFI